MNFVSTTNGCSNIVIVDNGVLCSKTNVATLTNKIKPSTYLVPNPNLGQLEFGYSTCNYSSFEDKLNWCGIILLELYSSCRCAEIKAGSIGIHASKIVNSYNDDKANFLKWNMMLSKVCKERFGLNICLNLDFLRIFDAINSDYEFAKVGAFDCYIDTKSDIFESPENSKIFESEDILYNFLAYEGSYIHCETHI